MVKIQVMLFFVLTGVTSNNAFISADFKNVLSHMNDKLYELVDEVFITLKIDVNFTKSEKVEDSFLLNNFVQNVSARNNKKYEEMYNLSKMTVDDNKTAYFIFIINEMMEDFIMLERKKLKPHISVKYYKNNLNNINNSNGILFSERDITFNLVKLNNKFNSKVEKSLIKDIVYKLLFANSKKSLRRSVDQDLKQWVFNASSVQTRRVYNGQAASVAEFPFVASVHIERRFACAGAIIRKDFIITAASCLKPFHSAQRIPHLNLEVRVASDFTSQYGELIPVTEMYFHPHFNHESLSNNLAVLKLTKRLKFNEKARKIMVDDKAYKMPENAENILILGWGSLNMKKEHQVETTPLSYAFVDVYNLQECKNVYSSFYVKEKNFCTGYVSKGSGACKNDIGGPAVVGSTLTGVISYGSPHCGQPDAPTVYTKLGYYADWINSVFDGYPEENNDIEQKSRYVSRPRELMTTSSESADYSSNVTSETDTLAQLIGELDVVKHINSTLTEILREKQTNDTNINTITDKDGPTSQEEDNDVINLDNVLQYFNQDSTSTTPESIAIPIDASEYENAPNYENIPIVNTKESEEETNNKNIYIDSKQFISDDTKSSPPKFGKLTTDAEVDEFTVIDEWPRTRYDTEILKEMVITNVTDSDSDTYNNNNNTESGSFELSPLALMSNDKREQSTTNVAISSKTEKKQILEIVFLTSTRPTRFSVKDSSSLREPPLPRNLPLIYYESSNRHKSFKESYF